MSVEISEANKQHKKRLRERFHKNNLDGFHNYEVLELILSYSIIRKDTKALAKSLINHFGSLSAVINAPINLLAQIEGIGERTASLIKLFREVGNFHLRESIIKNDAIKCSEDVYAYLKFYYKGLKNEEFKILYLNSRNIILFEETLFIGTINEARIYIRDIIKQILNINAIAIIITHNHPGGSLKASPEDIKLTYKIKTALQYFDIKILDHIIFTDNGFLSFAKEGIL